MRKQKSEIRSQKLAVRRLEQSRTVRRRLPYWGWGSIPDQYGRRWDSDDGQSEIPASPGLDDLPPILPWWGKQTRNGR